MLPAKEIQVVHTGVQEERNRFPAEFAGGTSDDESVVDILSIHGCFELYRQAFALKHIRHRAKTLLQLDNVMPVVDQQIEVAQKILTQDAAHLRREAIRLGQDIELQIANCAACDRNGLGVNDRKTHLSFDTCYIILTRGRQQQLIGEVRVDVRIGGAG